MTHKPILFNTEMVEAIVSGRKTQSRRPIKYNKVIANPELGFSAFSNDDEFSVRGKHEDGKYGESVFKLPYSTDDILWVRETWRLTDFLHSSDDNYGYIYKASQNGRDWEENSEGWMWKPSIHMPKVAARIFLKVTNVRIERLTDISESDAEKEGVHKIYTDFGSGIPIFKNYMVKKDELESNPWAGMTADSVDSFSTLWKSIYGEESWKKNAFVFVYEFELTERPENF